MRTIGSGPFKLPSIATMKGKHDFKITGSRLVDRDDPFQLPLSNVEFWPAYSQPIFRLLYYKPFFALQTFGLSGLTNTNLVANFSRDTLNRTSESLVSERLKTKWVKLIDYY